MSVFDKFLNTNPYVRTYVGAPVNEAVQVAGAMQQRYDKALTDMQQHEYALNNIPGVTASDKEFKAQYAADLAAEFDKLREAPEMAQQAINALASKYKQDPTLRAMASNKQKLDEWNETFAKDPEKYGDIASFQLQKAVAQYEANGGAKGGSLVLPKLYEQQDVNKFLLDNAAKIKASSDGKFVYNEAKGSIETIEGEQVTFEQAQQVLGDALMGDPKMRAQMQREFGYQQEALGFKGDFSDFIGQTTQGVANASAYSKVSRDAKGWSGPDGGSGGGDLWGGGWGVTTGEDYVMETAPEVKGIDNLRSNRKNRGNSAVDARVTIEEDRLWREGVAESNASDPVKRYLSRIGIDGIPYQTVTVNTPTGAGGPDGGAGRWAGRASVAKEVDQMSKSQIAAAFEADGYTPKQAANYAEEVTKTITGVWGDNVIDNMNDARKTAMQTKWATAEAEFPKEATRRGANSQVDMMVRSMPTITGRITGVDETGAFERTQEEMAETYEGYELQAWDIMGSGQIEIRAKRRDNQGDDAIILENTQDLADFWRNLEAQEVNRANASPAGSPQRKEYTKRALAISYPKMVQQVAILDSETNRATNSVPLKFGRLEGRIQEDFGQYSLGKDANGDYIVTLNGEDAFANNEKMKSAIANSNTASNAFAHFNQYLTKQYATAGSR